MVPQAMGHKTHAQGRKDMTKQQWLRKTAVVLTAVVLAVIGGVTAPAYATASTTSTPASVPGAIQPQSLVAFYRLWNQSSGDHFHTTDWNEVITAIQLGFTYEGIQARVAG